MCKSLAPVTVLEGAGGGEYQSRTAQYMESTGFFGVSSVKLMGKHRRFAFTQRRI